MRRPILVCSLLVLFSAPSQAQDPFFGDLARTHALTAADDYRIGKSYMEATMWMWAPMQDATLQGKLEGILRKIVAASDRPDMVLNVTLVDNPEINAAALPGGFLMVFRGAMEQLDDDELAFVLAHEVSHAQLRHFATTRNMEMATTALHALDPQQQSMEPEQRMNEMDRLTRMTASYSRNLEYEADLYGLLYAVRAGYPSAAGINAMRTLKDTLGPMDMLPEEYADHPSFDNRIEQMQRGIETVNATVALFPAGVTWLQSNNPEAATEAFQEFLALFPRSAAAWTNLAAAWLQQGINGAESDGWLDAVPVRLQSDVRVRGATDLLLDRARDACAKALNIDPNLAEPLGILAVLARRSSDLDAATQLNDKALALAPNNADLLNNRGVIEAASGHLGAAAKSLELARKRSPQHSTVAVNLALLAEARGKKKDAIDRWKILQEDPSRMALAKEHLKALGAKGSILESNIKDSAKVPASGLALGPISIGQAWDSAVASLGEPTFQDKEPNGLYAYAAWVDTGVSLAGALDQVNSIDIMHPADWRTREGMALGMPCAKAEEFYGSPLDRIEDPFGMTILTWNDKTIICDASQGAIEINLFEAP